jgi:ribosomal protein L11 methyltransferase
MKTDIYLEFDWEIEPLIEGREVLLAWLSELPFESFEDTDKGMRSFISKSRFEPSALYDILFRKPEGFRWTYREREIENENWNAVWESSFQPVDIGNELRIRAPFHPASNAFGMEIVVHPKMAFGTGHHQTTRLIAEAMLESSFAGLSVLDMGCGTGVLAILAAKLGAESVWAIDIEFNSVENTLENALLNSVPEIQVLEGGVEVIPEITFDMVFANINRNVLTADMPAYIRHLQPEGSIYLSGFFSADVPIIGESLKENGRKIRDVRVSGDWAMVIA